MMPGKISLSSFAPPVERAVARTERSVRATREALERVEASRRLLWTHKAPPTIADLFLPNKPHLGQG
jgi:hypothetical protein